jgi:chromosome segregation ATPase
VSKCLRCDELDAVIAQLREEVKTLGDARDRWLELCHDARVDYEKAEAAVAQVRQSTDQLQARYVNTRESLAAQLHGAERRADRAEAEVEALRRALDAVRQPTGEK